ncbi:serine--tRNA ligase [Candidatus Woesearchaeota archaeon]|nr:serine--tRNA ligase [Candidatus Woesearchaeota archaeon]
MFDAKYVKEHADELQDTLKRQKRDKELLPVLHALIEDEQKWRTLKQETDNLRSERNKISEAINATKKEGSDIKPLLDQAKAIPDKIKDVEERMTKLEHDYLRPKLAKLPNIMHKDVPYGASEEDNKEIKKWGTPTKAKVKNHVELCEANGWADFDASAQVSGNGFYYLTGDLALLQQALIRFAIETLTKKDYVYVEPPLLVRKHVLDAAMDSDGFQQSIYQVKEKSDDPLCLIGTAEHPILGLHENTVFKAEELPKKYAGYSMCFRQEIGSHGINEKGLWRTHQFNKVEQFVFCLPEQSEGLYQELMQNSEELLKDLELPYRVVEICTGDLALWKHRSHDIEVWRPTTGNYGEVMSLTNCTVYQAMDLGIRYVKKDGERGTVHTLNNTAIATSRIMVAILENHQNDDGSVNIPKKLQSYMGGKNKIK